MLMERSRARELGHQTLGILRAGQYRAPSGLLVDIRSTLEKAAAGTVSYPPDVLPSPPRPGDRPTMIEVRNESTLDAARRLAGQGLGVAALNFASATHPGGGWLNGARAQEESLARSSGLYACLEDNEMYDYHRARRDALYTDYVIYSPHVPVFRTDDGTLLEEPYLCSFLTSPAVNANGLRKYAPERLREVGPAMAGRICKVLAVARRHGHDTLVLGAWGCGAFGNDPDEIAELFHTALTAHNRGVFSLIVFAITDHWADQRNIGPLRRRFGLPA